MKSLILVLLIGAICCLAVRADLGEDNCPAAQNLRRTAHYFCHGFTDGDDNKKTAFGNCWEKAAKYNLQGGVDACRKYIPTGLNEHQYICDEHHKESSLPLFECLVEYFHQEVPCGLKGCRAKLYLTDDMNYELLQCYQTIFGKFPGKFDCED